MSDHPLNAASAGSQLEAPPAIPDMELLRRIGKGGFGEVWLARNRTTGGLRAVKVIGLRGTAPVDPAGREVVSLSRLEQTIGFRDANLVTIHHVGKTDDHLFYIMDLADDLSGAPPSCAEQYVPATLAARLDAGCMEGDDCVRWSRQLLAALMCLHRGGLVHRDVKPSNCLFIANNLKLADFGLLTDAGRTLSRVGTLGYMPPDGVMDTRADVYAAGLVIYEMITGLPVSCFPALQSRFRAILADGRLAALNRLAIQACHPDPKRRFANADAMLEELERLLAAEARATASGSTRRNEQGKSLSRRALIVSGAIGAGLAAVGFLWRWTASPLRVDVNFITEPFDATIWLDGQLLCDGDGAPYTTPCTVVGIPAEAYRLVFKHADLDDLEIDRIDLREHREIIARWPAEN